MGRNETKLPPHGAFSRKGASFWSNERGSIATQFALALIPLAMFGGAVIDYGRAGQFKAELQNAVDYSALRSLDTPDEVRLTNAEAVIARLDETTPSVGVSSDDDTVEISATSGVSTTILAVVGINRIPVHARAKARLVEGGPPACVLALNRTKKDAVSFSGSSSFYGRDCVVHSNSGHASGLSINGSATPTADGFCSVGGVSGGEGLSPAPRGNCRPIRDPFAKLPKPPASGCTHNNHKINPNQSRTLQPGVYCGGLDILGTATLDPGVYVIKDGSLDIGSQALVRGTGVTFYITGSNAGFGFNGGATIELEAPKTGKYGGVLIYQDPSSTSSNTINGGSDTIMNGAIYTPGSDIRLNGSSGFGQSMSYMPIIADTVTVTGSTDMKLDTSGVQLAAPLPQSSELVLVE